MSTSILNDGTSDSVRDALNALRDESLRIAREHGFTDASPGEDIALMHSELSEALEDLREGKRPAHLYFVSKDMRVHETPHDPETKELLKPCGVPSELADVIIRVMHFAGKHGIDIGAAVLAKTAYNESRPHKHGGKAF